MKEEVPEEGIVLKHSGVEGGANVTQTHTLLVLWPGVCSHIHHRGLAFLHGKTTGRRGSVFICQAEFNFMGF